MRHLLLLILCLNLYTVSKSQQYILSNKSQLNQKNSIYHRPIGQNGEGNYFLNYSRENLVGGFSIEKFDTDLGFISDRFFPLERRIYVLKIFTTDSGIYWISFYKKRKEPIKLYLNKINNNLTGNVQSWYVGSFENFNFNIDHLIAEYSLNRNNWVFGFIQQVSQNKSLVSVSNYDLKGELLFKNSDTIKIHKDFIMWESGSLSDSGKFVATISANLPGSFGSRNNRNQDLYIGEFSKQNAKLRKLILNNGQYLNSVLTLDPIKQSWHLCGIFSDENGLDIKGCFDQQIFQNQQSVLCEEYNFLPSQISQILGYKVSKRKDVLRNYFIRRVVLNNLGKTLFLLEQFNEMRQLETYYVNGIPQTATKISYHYGDLVGLFMNNEFLLDTFVVIRKDQSATIANAYLLGFGSYVCSDGVHIIFNDDIARKNQIVDWCIQPNYKIERKVIMNSDNFYNLSVPIDGKEMDYCSFTVPLFRDKQWFWMQVSANDK